MTLSRTRYALLLCALTFFPAKVIAKDWEVVRTQGMMKLVVVSKSKEASYGVYEEAIRSLCESGKYCYIRFWSDRRLIPSKIPMTEREANGMVASYDQNPKTRFQQLLVNCRINNDPNKCFR